ncbi:MAG: hypothetical protein AAF589_02260 [Planctomycetota bacterium]
MRSTLMLLAGVIVLGAVASALGQDAAAPTYQRSRAAYPPRGYRPARYPARHAASPQIASGSFQRPYPYHLDYYKQRYGGGYDPYFGNLYGPPNVVLSPGFGLGLGYGGLNGLPGGYQGQANAVGPVCPHCGQVWPTPLLAPGAGR